MAEDTNLALAGVTQGLESLKMSLGGVASGLQNMAVQMSSGGRSVMGGMSSMFGGGLPTSQFQQIPGIMAMPRHGMHISNMSLGRDMGQLSGFGTAPMGMYASEAMDLAARDVGNRFGGAATMGGIYGTGAAASWFGYDAMSAMMPKALGGAGFFSGWGLSGASGGLLKLAAPMLGSVGISMAFERAAKDVQEHMAMVNYMRDSSFRYAFGGGAEQDPRSGVGFSRAAAGDIARGARGIATEDLSLDMGDVTGIIDKGTQLGLFRGANTSEAFLGKVKELASAVKKVSRTLKMSLDEGMTAMAEMDQMGITNPAAMAEFARRSDVVGAASGYTGQEMLGFGRMAGEMARGSWVNQAAAGNMMQQNIMAGTFLQNKGILSAEAIAQGGGIVNISQGLTQASMAAVNNPYLNTIIMGMAAGGGVGGSLMGALAGGAGPTEMMARTMGAMSSPGQFIRANIHRDETISALSKAFGGQGTEAAMLMAAMGEAKEMAPLYGVSRKEYLQFSLENRYGLTTSQADLLVGKMENFGQIRADMARQEEISRVREQRETLIRDYSVTGMAGRAVGRVWEGAVVNPLTRAADAVSGGFEQLGLAAQDLNIRFGAFMAGETISTAGRNLSAGSVAAARTDFAVGGGTRLRGMGFEEDQKIRDYTRSDAFKNSATGWRTNSAFVNAANIDDASHAMFKTNYTRLTDKQKIVLAANLQGNNTGLYNDVQKQMQSDYMRKTGVTGSIDRMNELEGEVETARRHVNLGSLGDVSRKLFLSDNAAIAERFLGTQSGREEEIYSQQLKEAGVSEADRRALLAEKRAYGRSDIVEAINYSKTLRGKSKELADVTVGVGAKEAFEGLYKKASGVTDQQKQSEIYKDLGTLGKLLAGDIKGTKAVMDDLKDLTGLGDAELTKAISSGNATAVRDYFGKKGADTAKGAKGTWYGDMWNSLTGGGEAGGAPSESLAERQLELASQMEQMIQKFKAYGYSPNVAKPSKQGA